MTTAAVTAIIRFGSVCNRTSFIPLIGNSKPIKYNTYIISMNPGTGEFQSLYHYVDSRFESSHDCENPAELTLKKVVKKWIPSSRVGPADKGLRLAAMRRESNTLGIGEPEGSQDTPMRNTTPTAKRQKVQCIEKRKGCYRQSLD